MPEMMVTDNCCQVHRAVESALPETDCILDVWHFIARYIVYYNLSIYLMITQIFRYIAVILNSGKNVYRAAVAADITNAVLKRHLVKGSGAEYWNKAEQEQRLEAAFAKWAEKGTVWSAAAMQVRTHFFLPHICRIDRLSHQVHKEQLNHVRKGCLERRRQDIPSDGSCIEGSHKGWNSLQRVQPSEITVLVVLGHDFVLRRNIRVAYGCASPAHGGLKQEDAFLISTHGSHHVSLVSAIAALHNGILKNGVSFGLTNLPELAVIHSGETFGLITSDHASTFGGLVDVKEEPTNLELNDTSIMIQSLEFKHDSTADLTLQASRPLLEELEIDLQLLNQPASRSAVNTSTTATKR